MSDILGSMRLALGVLLCGALMGCGSDDHSASSPDLAIQFQEPDPPDLAHGPVSDLSPERNRDAACGATVVGAEKVYRPVDYVFLVDNSASMSDEVRAVQDNLNAFAGVLARRGDDYRIIVFSHYGYWGQSRICIPPPLGTQAMNCNPPEAQVRNNPPRYFHYNWNVQSPDAFGALLKQYDIPDLDGNPVPQGTCGGGPCAGWNQYLRKGASKVFVVVTDDKSGLSAADIEQRLAALDGEQFGAAGNRNYRVHALVGLPANTPPTRPWGPKDPLQGGLTCGVEVFSPGIDYQQLAIDTGGLRFPICERTHYDALSLAIAADRITRTALPCTIAIPPPPDRETIEPVSVIVEFSPSAAGGTAEDFYQVLAPADCAPGAYYLVGTDEAVLCPAACARVQGNPSATLRLLYYCR